MDKQPSISQINRFPIVDYLRGLGIEPVKVRGNDYWYLSPLRAEKQPSFKVNAKLNLWYDFGLGKGGTLYDLGIRLQGDEQMLRNTLLPNIHSYASSSNIDERPVYLIRSKKNRTTEKNSNRCPGFLMSRFHT